MTAPKFQAQHADLLIDPRPEAAAPPGLDPFSETRALAEALGSQAHAPFPAGQGHGLRAPDVLRQAPEQELGFLNAVTAR